MERDLRFKNLVWGYVGVEHRDKESFAVGKIWEFSAGKFLLMSVKSCELTKNIVSESLQGGMRNEVEQVFSSACGNLNLLSWVGSARFLLTFF